MIIVDLKTQEAEKGRRKRFCLNLLFIGQSKTQYLRCSLDDLLDDKRPVLKKHERASEVHRSNLPIFSISARRGSVLE